MPSTQARTKLKAFQFIEGAPTVATTKKEREAEKENHSAVLGKASTTDGMKRTLQTAKDTGKAAATPKPATSKTCPPPSTPSMKRLPLADLVGNIDDSSRHAPQPVVSPEEQLVWRGSQPMNTPLPRKNKKRARSSSPVAPSQEDHTLDGARKDLTTPQADPAMELWTRYTSNKGTPSANKSVAFAHLINESSPRSSVAAGSVSGLRRWASCGHEFPASNRKRRRTHGVFQGENDRTEDVFATAPSSDGMMLGQQGKSNIASMVQRMKECVKSQPRISSQLPSSSSPFPDTGDRHAGSAGSPLQRRVQEQEMRTSETMEEEVYEELEEELYEDNVEEDMPIDRPEPERCSASSDDFGDDDFDDMVDALDVSPQEVGHLEQAVQPTSYVTIPTEPIQPPREQVPVVAQDDADSDDEFGMDGDEDEFAADLEQVASLYDTRPTLSPSQKAASAAADIGSHTATRMSAPTTPVINLVDDEDDDEFGDEIDADVFAAAEVAATQPSANNVRRTSTFQ
jgi:DNA replication ATP-dependent helicase Dna2